MANFVSRKCVLGYASFLFALLSVSPLAWTEGTLVGQSLEKLQQSPPAGSDCFDFVVVGDSNTLLPLEQSDVFKECVKEFNILRPALVTHVGDIVLGGASEGVAAQWDLFDEVIKTCEPPFLPAPGNHDISDEATERIWLERVGPTRYSVQYRNSCFIFLDSEEVGALGRISDEQVEWLKKQLASTAAANVFVFLHQPYFEQEGDPDTAGEYWDKHWANVAETFRGHPVKVVFAGHEHIYRDCGEREGVRYVITGGAASYGVTGREDVGSFHHYLWVRVRGEDVSWAVVKPFSILPEQFVTSERIDELYNISNKWVQTEEVFAPLGEAVNQDMHVTIRNVGSTPMSSSLSWDCPAGWNVTPQKTDYEVAANSAAELAFHVSTAKAEDARFPVPALSTLYKQTQHGPAVEVQQDMKFVPTISAVRAQGEIKLDGVLDEWPKAQMAQMTYPVSWDGKNSDDLQCRLGFMWDDGHLYMAVETQDNDFYQPYAGDIVWSADCVEMFIDDWSWGLSLTANGPEVFLYWGVDVSAETVSTDVKLAVKRDGTKVTYEAAFPQSHLTPLVLAAGNSFRFNALMNDLDQSGPEKARHWLQLLPDARSAGNPRPCVKVVLNK